MGTAVDVLTLGSAVAGIAAVVFQVIATTRQGRLAGAEVRRLTQGEEQIALQSDNMRVLGRYLYENIGSTRISNYVSNKKVRDQVSRALEGVLAFLGTEATVLSSEESEEAAQEAPDLEVTIREFEESEQDEPSEMARALEEMTYGEVWNGLARMRRHIESQLRYITPEASRYQRQSTGRLLTILNRDGYVSDRAEKLLRYAIDVANAGIHGTEISVRQAQEAWEAAVRGIASLPDTTQGGD